MSKTHKQSPPGEGVAVVDAVLDVVDAVLDVVDVEVSSSSAGS